MKFTTIIVLIILTIGVLCPSQIIIKHNDDTPQLIKLNVCNVNGPALSVDSSTPVLITTHVAYIISPPSDIIFYDNETSYNFLSVKEILRPPRA